MKTIKFLSVISLVLIFAGTTNVFSGSFSNYITGRLVKAPIKYQVNINLPLGVEICNTYLVQVTDENGRVVAHPQVFVPGISKYVFEETFTTPGKERIAWLVLAATLAPSICPINLITQPDTEMGPFYPGQTYSFYLNPVIVKEAVPPIPVDDGNARDD
jgi:hypothetical protein